MSKNNPIKQDNSSESWKEQEVVDWSSTEGYEEVKRVNDFLRWPALWGSKKTKNKQKVIIDGPEKQKSIKDKVKQVDLSPQSIVSPKIETDQLKTDLVKKKSRFKLLFKSKYQPKIDSRSTEKSTLGLKTTKTTSNTQLADKTKLVEQPRELIKDSQPKSQLELTTKVKSAVPPVDQLTEEVKKDLVQETKTETNLNKDKAKFEINDLAQAKSSGQPKNELGQQDKPKIIQTEIKEPTKIEAPKAVQQPIKAESLESVLDQQASIKSKDLLLAREQLVDKKRGQEPVTVKTKTSWRQKLLEQKAVRRLKRANQLRNRQLKQATTSGQSSFQDKEAQRQAVVKQATARVNQVSQVADLPKKPVVEPMLVELKPSQSELAKADSSQKAEPALAQVKKVSNGTVKLSTHQQQRFQDLKQSLEQKSWSRPAITEVNLAKDQMTLYFNWNKFWIDLTQWLVVTLFFLSLCGALFYLWRQNQDKQAGDVTKHLARANQLITLTENEVSGVLDFRSRVQVISGLLSQHIYWSNFFNFLEKNTLPNVFYQDFVGNTNGEYIFKARTDSFDSMAKQLKVFRQAPEVLEVSSEGGEMVKSEVIDPDDENRVIESSTQLNFSIRIKINPELFSF